MYLHHVWLCHQERQIAHCGKDTLISPDLRRFKVRRGRKGNNHSRHLGNLLLGTSGRQATVQTAPAPTPPTPRALLSCCPLPQASPKAPRQAPLQGWEGHPTPSTRRDCHQHPQPGTPSQPAVLIIFSHEISQWLFSLLSGQRPKSTARLLRHCLGPPTPPCRDFLSHMSPTFCSSYPGSDTLLPVLPIRPFLAQ